jgi:hypothetical protein
MAISVNILSLLAARSGGVPLATVVISLAIMSFSPDDSVTTWIVGNLAVSASQAFSTVARSCGLSHMG